MIVNAVWIGGELPMLHRMCINSWMAQGHTYRVWAYDSELELPDGAELHLAKHILPEPIYRYENKGHEGSPVLHANIFRYKFLAEYGGAFVDADTLCLSHRLPSGHCISSENPLHDIPNFAFVNLPKGEPCMVDCYCEAMRRLKGERKAGLFGPRLLGERLRDNGQHIEILPTAAFCKVRWNETDQFFNANPPDLDWCYGVHLWARVLNKRGRLDATYADTSLWEQWKKAYG